MKRILLVLLFFGLLSILVDVVNSLSFWLVFVWFLVTWWTCTAMRAEFK